MPIYRTEGKLTGTILPENVAAAQKYLTEDDMTQYLDSGLEKAVERIRWYLDANGHDYYVEAITTRELNDDELRVLSEWVSGQNSDGLGEGFEQQPFAEEESEDEDCYKCGGTGLYRDDEDDAEDCPTCDGAGYFEGESGGMISFDWNTNRSIFTRV